MTKLIIRTPKREKTIEIDETNYYLIRVYINSKLLSKKEHGMTRVTPDIMHNMIDVYRWNKGLKGKVNKTIEIVY